MALEFFNNGMTFETYLQRQNMNVPTMRENFNETVVPEEDDAYLRWLENKVGKNGIKIVALSESWCGDCVENLPIIAKLSASYSCFDLRIFPRDENLEIMDRYLTDGKRTIPVFVFYDSRENEIGRFIERPRKAHEFMNAQKAKLAGLTAAERDRAMYEIRTELRKLYKQGLRNETIKEVRHILERVYPFENR